MNRASKWLVMGAFLSTAGCADEPPLASTEAGIPLTAFDISEAISRSLGSADIRAELVSVFRGSEYVEHKLELDELLRRAPRLHGAVAGALGVSRENVVAFAAVNAHDVYLPFVEDRITWDGGAVPAVAYTDDVDGYAATVYGGEDGPVWVRLADLREVTPLIVVHPAEPKSRRVGFRNADPALRTIQGVEEAQLGGILTYSDVSGAYWEVELADIRDGDVNPMLEQCFENCYGGGGGGGDPTPDVYNIRLKAAQAYYGDGVGSAEVEWRFTKGPHSTTVRIEGLDHGAAQWSHETVFRNTLLFSFSSAPSGTIDVSAKETDAFSDDPWGTGTVGVGFSGEQPVDHVGYTSTFCTEVGDFDSSGCHHTLDFGNSTVTTEFMVRGEFIAGS